jgi:asparagine synthase (glutamine-hydrolysing)
LCGIAGFVGEADPEALARMMGRLTHRGPDGRGSWSDGRVHLGHTRLAVIDLEGGRQPFHRADASLSIVFNGEIYDHARLREELRSQGHVFQSQSDTEVILEAYQAWGPECITRLHGMFAFVIYDRNRRRLFGGRDRFGKKPLFFAGPAASSKRLSFAFASEASSLREHPQLREEFQIDERSVALYLLHDAVPSPMSIWSGARQLAPGHIFTFDVDSGSLQIQRYWDRLGAIRPVLRSEGAPSPEASPGRLLELLDAGVERRLVSDVPLGVFLSGGVDSSAVVALAARHRPAGQIPTFSIGFDDPSFDESTWARRVAEHFGTEHHHRLFTSEDMLARLDQVIGQLDEPLADPSILPTALLSQFAREHVTVALSGEGGDELLAGYDPFRALSAASWYRRIVPRWLTPWIRSAAGRLLPASEKNMSLDFKVDRFLRGLAVAPEIQLATWIGSFSIDAIADLMPDRKESLTAEILFADVLAHRRELGRLIDANEVDHSLDFFQRFYLPNDILRKVDRASMMYGLELRCPFLDTSLAEYVNALPSAAKFQRGKTKILLKKALAEAKILPPAVIERPKKGFGIPIARWLRTTMREEVQTHLVQDWPWSLEFIDRQRVGDLVRDHFSRRANRAKEIWSLLVLSKWAKGHSA